MSKDRAASEHLDENIDPEEVFARAIMPEEALMVLLSHAYKLYCGSQDTAQLQGLGLSLLSVGYYLLEIDAPPEYSQMFRHLSEALFDLERGAHSPLIVPKNPKKRGRKRDSLRKERNLTAASALVSVLLELGESEEKASRQVIKFLKALKLPIPEQQVNSERPDWRRLQDWRDKLLSKRADEHWSRRRQHYEWLFSTFSHDPLTTLSFIIYSLMLQAGLDDSDEMLRIAQRHFKVDLNPLWNFFAADWALLQDWRDSLLSEAADGHEP